MTEKENQVLDIIKEYYKINKMMPSIRFIQEKLHLKSTNSIMQYYKTLEKKNYLIRNSQNHLILNNYTLEDENLKTINILNSKKTISLLLDKRKEYLGFILHHNDFIKDNLQKDDLLIIEKTKKIQNNNYGLFIIDKKYRIMKYNYQDGFYILQDKEQVILNKINTIGKVVMMQRKI